MVTLNNWFIKRLYSFGKKWEWKHSNHWLLFTSRTIAKTIGSDLKVVMRKVVQMVNLNNWFKSRPLKSRLFAHICEEMGAKFTNLILYTEVRWLARGGVLCYVYELKEMMFKLFREIKQTEFCYLIQNELCALNWHTFLTYLNI